VSPSLDDPFRLTVSPERFGRQLDWLRRRGLRGVSLRDLLATAPGAARASLVALPFDDAFRDFIEFALPVLLRYGFGATVYVVAGRVGGVNDWEQRGPTRPLMTDEDIRAAAGSGIEIGSHGLSHRRLPAVSGPELEHEVAHSRELLERVIGPGTPVCSFAYPYGEVGIREIAAVKAAGYRQACAVGRSEQPGLLAMPRTYVGDRDGGLRLAAKRLRFAGAWRGATL
jgi:peptidoglycan/xylan/chitin deacetylase (PgdA/CDA1 family)